MKFKDIFIILSFFIILFIKNITNLITDYLWFKDINYTGVFITILKTEIIVGIIAFLLFFIFIYANIYIANKNVHIKGVEKSYVIVILIFSLIFGLISSLKWDTVLLYLNQVDFNIKDPIFLKDISFYVFSLPFYNFVVNSLIIATFFSGIGIGIIYLFNGEILSRFGDFSEYPDVIDISNIPDKAKIHTRIILGFMMLLISIYFYLSRYDILYKSRSSFYGPGYAEVNIQLVIITIISILSFIVFILFLLSIKKINIKIPIIGLIFIIIFSMLGGFFTTLVHQYKVLPDEYTIEEPYIKNSINYTRFAFDLNTIKQIEFPVSNNLTSSDIDKNKKTIDNIRLWDWRPLLSTYRQLQLIRTYYEFKDIDINRYTIYNKSVQVALSAREINADKLPQQAQTWVNQKLYYTHGYGIAMSPVNGVSKEGLPEFYIKDVPPSSDIFEITRPEIYYGEIQKDYVIVKTKTKEFDYPKGEKNIDTHYSGDGGVILDSFLKRLFMAFRFGDINILISDSIQPYSKIMFYRNIENRVNRIAPFLLYDTDPYIALSDGKLYWILDAYTVTDKFPYSEPTNSINYIRNPVKVVIDAYDGSVTFYKLNSVNDPIIDTFSNIFPELFEDFSNMPQNLKTKIRYPEDLFLVQADKYALYHMKDPKVFYNREDVWEFPEELYEGNTITMQPYYLITKLPNFENEEFILFLPFTPRGKKNMISWMAARNDLSSYGERLVYMFPKDKLIYGPMQIEARIDQNPDISESFTLWSQSGSSVIRGNLLIVPVDNSLLYIEPIYLKAQQRDAIPELKRVIVAYGDNITMQDNLDMAIYSIFNRTIKSKTVVDKKNVSYDNLVKQVIEHYDNANQFLVNGDLEAFGREIKQMGAIIENLKQDIKTNN